jgi:hypothetical protein
VGTIKVEVNIADAGTACDCGKVGKVTAKASGSGKEGMRRRKGTARDCRRRAGVWKEVKPVCGARLNCEARERRLDERLW